MDVNNYNIGRGEYVIIETDGTEKHIRERPTLEVIQHIIGCAVIDTVPLTKGFEGPEVVMVVDDVGMFIGSPVNDVATKLYHALCPGAHYPIYGIAVLVNDKDFGL